MEQKQTISAPYFPTDVWKIIARKLIQDPSAEQAAKNFLSLAKTSRFFAQLSQDPNFNCQLTRDYARYFSEELDALCPHDLVFAAAYCLHTPGAKQWVKTEYLKEPLNFKIVSSTFFERLALSSLPLFVQKTFPKTIPNSIHERLIHISQSHIALREYIRTLLPTTSLQSNDLAISLSHALCRSLPNEEIENLLKNGADPDSERFYGTLPLSTAIRSGNAEAVRLLLQYGANPNNQTGEFEPVLFQALKEKRIEILKLLLAAGANPNARKGRETPLIYAISNMDSENIKHLLNASANPNMPSRNGISILSYPLELAILYNQTETVTLLLAAGADTDLPFRNGMKPIQYAYALIKTEIENILKQHEEKKKNSSGTNS